MKNQIFIILLCLFALPAMSQQNAVTENGEEVLLNPDGTWEYVNQEDIEQNEIPINPKEFHKGDKSSFLLKSKKTDIGIWLNPKIWKFAKASENPEAEYEFELKNGDLYGMLISEKFEIPIETLRGIAIENGRSVAPNLEVVNEEYRNVNGNQVLLLHMEGTMQGIEFAYYGYYFSNESGTIQFITYTSQNLMKEYKKTSEALLNGLVSIK